VISGLLLTTDSTLSYTEVSDGTNSLITVFQKDNTGTYSRLTVISAYPMCSEGAQPVNSKATYAASLREPVVGSRNI